MKTRTTAVLVAVSLMITLALTPACVKQPPNLTPAGQAAFNADQVVQALKVVTDTVIAANQPGANPHLNDADAKAVLQGLKLVVTAVAASPGGWKPAGLAAWAEAKKALTPAQAQVLALYIGMVDILFK